MERDSVLTFKKWVSYNVRSGKFRTASSWTTDPLRAKVFQFKHHAEQNSNSVAVPITVSIDMSEVTFSAMSK